MRHELPQRIGRFRAPPQQDERVPQSIVPAKPCPCCGHGDDRGAAVFKRTLDRATSADSKFDALAGLIGMLYPGACSVG